MQTNQVLIDTVLRIADNALIHGHRISEWCSKGPEMEIDIALTNIALDHVGRSRYLYQYAATLIGNTDEDQLAYLRDAWDFKNILLVEQANGDFANTIVKNYFIDSFHVSFFLGLQSSADKQLAGIAEKSSKEVKYHQTFSRDWMRRLGQGTELSHSKLQEAVDHLWPFSGEMIVADDVDAVAIGQQLIPDINGIGVYWKAEVQALMQEIGIIISENAWMQSGGKKGIHTEQLGLVLAEMQFIQRAYPNSQW